MRRREFIAGLGGAATAWPLAAGAQQQPAMPVIGYLGAASPDLYDHFLRAFHQGLGEMGYVAGRNVRVEYRFAEGQYDRLPRLAADLVRLQVDVIVAGGLPAALAAKSTTSTIPIAFLTSADPVDTGLVASLNRPGGNVTGTVSLAVELVQKRLEVLRELLPTATTMALIINPANPIGETQRRESEAAARIIGVKLHVLHATTERDFASVFAELDCLRPNGLLMGSDTLFLSRAEQIAALTVRHALPAIFPFPEFVRAGGLMAYSSSVNETYRLMGVYTGRILKGEKPADLPVQQSTRVELIINMKTARALGLTFPLTLLGRADEVIE
jgi:putative tryptophan/tyrosine transport system substrate-binding protein